MVKKQTVDQTRSRPTAPSCKSFEDVSPASLLLYSYVFLLTCLTTSDATTVSTLVPVVVTHPPGTKVSASALARAVIRAPGEHPLCKVTGRGNIMGDSSVTAIGSPSVPNSLLDSLTHTVTTGLSPVTATVK